MKSLKLPQDLRIQAAAALKSRMLSALDGNGTLKISGNAVERVDTAGLQVLLAAAREAEKRGRVLSLHAPSTPLAEALARLGLEHHLSIQTAGGRRRTARD